MISKTFEWYRIVSATPTTQAVEARTKAVEELIASLSEIDPDKLLAMTKGIVCGFSNSPVEADTIEWLLRTLKQHDPAVSESLSENKFELRCIAAITLGEILQQRNKTPMGQDTIAAALFTSAMYMRPLPRQRYLKAAIEEISAMAQDVIEAEADSRRERIHITGLGEKELAAPDLPTAKKAISLLQDQIVDLERNADMDREEMRLFWFFATGLSRTNRKPFSHLPLSVAAVHAALDFDRLLLTPAPLNSFELLTAIVESKRKPEDLKPVPLKEHLSNWSSREWDAIAVSGSIDADFATRFPAIFPMTWIANRMREAQALPNWTEFNRITHLRGEATLSAAQIGHQLLNEKVAVKLIGGFLE